MPAVVTGLGRQKRLTKHHDAIPHAEIPFFLSYVRESRTYPAKPTFPISTCRVVS